MRMIEKLTTILLQPLQISRQKRWASTAPEITFASPVQLVQPEDWKNMLDGDDAATYIRRAAMAGLVDAQVALARMHLTGSGAVNDATEALPWLERAVRAGNAEAMNMLARCHELGRGVPADPKVAAEYYRMAGDLGDVWAMFNLADLYCRGRGVEPDDTRAFALYSRAANQGHIKSLNMLGLFYEEGRSVPVDRARAIELFSQGASGGDCWAQMNYGRVLLEDDMHETAHKWMRRALENGFPDFWSDMAACLANSPSPTLQDLAREAAARIDSAGSMAQ